MVDPSILSHSSTKIYSMKI